MAFKKGDKVTVYNQTMRGMPIIEGEFVVVRPAGVSDQYRVKMPEAGLGDPARTGVDRFIFEGEAQTDPKGYLAKAQKEWAERTGNEGWLAAELKDCA